MYSKDAFLFNEKEMDGSCREGCYIKGYVRDIWAYLKEAYLKKKKYDSTH